VTVSPYSDGSAYDALVDDHCFPSTTDEGDELGLTPADARRTHFQNVAAPLTATAPAASRGDSPPERDVAGALNVSGARLSPGAA
jgi:hypothetical protein